VTAPLAFPRSAGTCLARFISVLITRCAWHRGYHGHPALIGVTDWRGLRLGFSDGICSQCAAQLRADVPGSPLNDPWSGTDVAGWMPGVGLVTIAVMAVVLFAARPVHEPPEVRQIADAIVTEPRPADPPRAGVVVAPRAVEPRFRAVPLRSGRSSAVRRPPPIAGRRRHPDAVELSGVRGAGGVLRPHRRAAA
jgi:hypothetical protein